MYFLRVGTLFTRSVRVGCNFQASRGEITVNSLSVSLPGLSVNQTGLSVTSNQLVPNMEFQTVRDDKLTVREVLKYSR